jgi:hypothetical protein
VIAELVSEISPLWQERHQARLASRLRKQAVGVGAKHRLVFVDRLLATLVYFRHAATHDVLALRCGEYGEAIHGLLGPVDELLADLV